MNVALQIATYLDAQLTGSWTLGTNIFVSQLPASPDNCIMIRDSGGEAPSIYIPTGRPTFQIFVRHKNYATGLSICAQIRTLLHNKYNTTLVSGGNYFYSINAIQEPSHIGKDLNEREEFSFNFQTYIR